MSESSGMVLHQAPKGVSRHEGLGNYAGMLDLAAQLVTTGFLPAAVKTPAQALAIILTGQELGIGPMQALRSISIVQGKPVLGADLQLALFKRDGGKAEWVVLDEKAAELHLTHRNGDEHRERYTTEDAKAAGLLFKDNWKKFPKAMLRSRCITAGLKSVGYEPTSGVYDPEELGQEVVIENVDDRGEEGLDEGRGEVARGAEASPSRKEAITDAPNERGSGELPVRSAVATAPAPSPSLSKGKQALSQRSIDLLLRKAAPRFGTNAETGLLICVFEATGIRPESCEAKTWPKVDVDQYEKILAGLKAPEMPDAVQIEDMETRLLEMLKDQTLKPTVRVAVLAEYENARDKDMLTVEKLQEWLGSLAFAKQD